MLSVLAIFGCFAFILFSYVQIFRAVLRMPSEQGRHKAFSMCLLHLAVLSLLVSTATFANLKPPSISSPSLGLVVSFLYSVLPPAFPGGETREAVGISLQHVRACEEMMENTEPGSALSYTVGG